MNKSWRFVRIGSLISFILNYAAIVLAVFLAVSIAAFFFFFSEKSGYAVKVESGNGRKSPADFTVYLLFEHIDQNKLKKAVDFSVHKLKNLEGVSEVNYEASGSFYSKYKYMLLNTDDIDLLYKQALKWNNKAGENKLNTRNEDSAFADSEDNRIISSIIQRINYSGNYFRNYKGNIYGIEMLLDNDLEGRRFDNTIRKIKNIASQSKDIYNVWAGVIGPSFESELELVIFEQGILIAWLAAVFFAFLFLLISFRNFFAALIALIPSALSCLLSLSVAHYFFQYADIRIYYYLVPLSSISLAFSIFIIYSFRKNLKMFGMPEALIETYETTGFSAALGIVCMIFAIAILFFSSLTLNKDLAFSGLIFSILILFINMLFLPVLLYYSAKIKLIKMYPKEISKSYVPGLVVTIIIFLITAGLGVYGAFNLNYDNRRSFVENNQNDFIELEIIRQKKAEVFFNNDEQSLIYKADNLEALDSFLKKVNALKQIRPDVIGRFSSIRDVAPGKEDIEKKTRLINNIKKLLQEPWTLELKDSIKQIYIKNMKSWNITTQTPSINSIPFELSKRYRDEDGKFIITVNPAKDINKDDNAAQFVNIMSKMKTLPGISGPSGEPLDLSQVEKKGKNELYLLTSFSILLIFIIILLVGRNIISAVLSVFPALFAVFSSAGIMAILNIDINYYHYAYVPVLIASASAGGIFYVNRWKQEALNIVESQKELINPLSSFYLISIAAMPGFIISDHPGISSIAFFIEIFLLFAWLITLLFLPGVLNIINRNIRYFFRSFKESASSRKAAE